MSNLVDKILYNKPLSLKQEADLRTSSIIRNLQHILNTRSSIGIKEYLSENTVLTNLNFGLPDLSFVSITSTLGQNTLIKLIKKAISSFEPRLKNITIELGDYDPIQREINVKVSAYLDRDNIAVNFLLNLSTLEFLINERERQ